MALQLLNLAVFIFFVLSGFLMGYKYFTLPCTTSNVMSYAKARVARIVPLYYFMCLLCFHTYTRLVEGVRAQPGHIDPKHYLSLWPSHPHDLFRAMAFISAGAPSHAYIPTVTWTIPPARFNVTSFLCLLGM